MVDSMPASRRRFLRHASLAGVGTVAAILAMPDPPPERPTDRPGPPWDRERPTITEEHETPYAIWQYSRERDGFRPTSPINVVVSLGRSQRTFRDVMAVFWDAGWIRRPGEYTRFAFNVHTGEFERQHATAAQTYFGAFGRHHIRAWHFGETVSIQAHQDTRPMPEHEIASYERTKHHIEALFDAADWVVKPDGASFGNDTPPDHEGLVTVIEA